MFLYKAIFLMKEEKIGTDNTEQAEVTKNNKDNKSDKSNRSHKNNRIKQPSWKWIYDSRRGRKKSFRRSGAENCDCESDFASLRLFDCG